jgi:hypothetical protein
MLIASSPKVEDFLDKMTRREYRPEDGAKSKIALRYLGKGYFSLTSLLPAFRRPGDSCEVTRPDPIPNSAVKRFSANGTMS